MLQLRRLIRPQATLLASCNWSNILLVHTQRHNASSLQNKNTGPRKRKVNKSGTSKPSTPSTLAHFKLDRIIEQSDPLFPVNDAIQGRDLETASILFTEFLKKGTRYTKDFHIGALAASVLSAVLEEIRAANNGRGQKKNMAQLVEFGNMLISAVTREQTDPSPTANSTLLLICEKTGNYRTGIEFWKWIQASGLENSDLKVYGQAIELLAITGTPLEQLEELFTEALRQNPGTFLQYHLSPNTILPDRNQPFDHDSYGGINKLLQAMTKARIIHGQARDAYLDLDTALRLFPQRVSNDWIFLYLNNRPPAETIQIMISAITSGGRISVSLFHQVLSKLASTPGYGFATARFLTLRQMLSLIYIYRGYGGEMTASLLLLIVEATTGLMKLRGIENLEREDLDKIGRSVLTTVTRTLEVFARFGTLPERGVFDAIIRDVAGHCQSKQILDVALKDIETLGLSPGIKTYRSMLIAAGKLRDQNLVRGAWTGLVLKKAEQGHLPTPTDIQKLITISGLCGCLDYAEDVAQKAMAHIPEIDHDRISNHLATAMDTNEVVHDQSTLDISQLLSELAKVRADLDFMESRSKLDRALGDFGGDILPMTLEHPANIAQLPEPELRKFYNELTTEQRSSTAEQEKQAITPEQAEVESERSQGSSAPNDSDATDSASNSLASLRYEHWKSINYLLALSEANDKGFQKHIDAATAKGKKSYALSSFIEVHPDVETFGLSDFAEVRAAAAKPMTEEKIQEARADILRLRGMATA